MKKFLMLGTMTTSAFGMFVSSMSVATADSNASAQSQQQAFVMPTPPNVMAASVLLMDASNGQVLYAKDADQRRAPASTTKLMTMLLVMKAIKEHKISWNDEVPITGDAYKVTVTPDVSNAYLDPKEHKTLKDMMDYIAVLSANDATVAVADKIGGDTDAFVLMMNQEAKALGMTNTHYMNPDGLPQDNHYTSARDLATLARYLVTNYPDILQFTSQPQITVRNGNTWTNTDELIGHYPGVDGLKTGYTADAGYCYVGTAQQNGRRVISVVMGDTKNNIHQRFLDTAKLFDFGFHQFSQTSAVKPGQTLPQTISVSGASHTKLNVEAKNGLTVDLPTGVTGSVKVVADAVSAPVKQGDKVGQVEYVVGNQVVAATDLVAAEDDGKANWFVRMMRGIGSWFGHLFHH